VHVLGERRFEDLSPRQQIGRVVALFKPHWLRALALVGIICLSATLSIVPAVATERIIDRVLPSRDLSQLALFVAAVVAASVLVAVLGACEAYLNARLVGLVVRDLRVRLVTHMHKVPIAFYSESKAGSIMNRVTGDVSAVENLLSGSLMPAVSNTMLLAVAFGTMFAFNWKLTVLAVLSVPLMLLPSQAASGRLFDVQSQARDRYDAIAAIVQQTLSVTGITLMRMFGRESFEAARFEQAATDLLEIENRFAAVSQRFGAVISGASSLGPALVWLGGGFMCIRYGVQAGVVVAFAALLTRLYEPVTGFIGIHLQIAAARAVFARVYGYLALPTERSRAVPGGAGPRLHGRIEFRHVSFAYRDGREALRNVSFAIEPGRVAALVGPSGAGKSTVAQLLTGLYELQTGSILIDGVDLRELDTREFRRHVGIVTQETYLFHDTIAANLRYAKPDASADELAAAARAASVHDFIASLPEGYETVVGDRGYMLSGGERQRLAIARVLLKNPLIFVLDEATSALDSQNESAIQVAFEAAMHERTSIVIAHRLSTIASADLILVLDNGSIVEQGTHRELIGRGGLYAELYREQHGENGTVLRAG